MIDRAIEELQDAAYDFDDQREIEHHFATCAFMRFHLRVGTFVRIRRPNLFFRASNRVVYGAEHDLSDELDMFLRTRKTVTRIH